MATSRLLYTSTPAEADVANRGLVPYFVRYL